MTRQYRFSSVVRLAFRVWLRNVFRFTLLSLVFSAPLALWLALDTRGLSSAELILPALRNYGLVALRGLSSLVTPMISAYVVQSLAGVELSLPRSVWLSWRGVLTLLTFLLLGIVLSFVPVLGIVVSLCLNCIGFVAIPAAITERLDPLTALGRSSHLSAGRYRTTFALMLASAAVAVIPTGVAHVSLVMWHDAMSSYSFEWMAQLRPYALAMVALSSLLMPFQGTVRAVSYVQLRRDSPGVEGDLAQVFE